MFCSSVLSNLILPQRRAAGPLADRVYPGAKTAVEPVNRIAVSARRSREVGEKPTRCRHCKREVAFRGRSRTGSHCAQAWEGTECGAVLEVIHRGRDPRARILERRAVLSASARRHRRVYTPKRSPVRNCLRVVLAVIFIPLTATLALAQTVSGRVIDSSGRTLPSAYGRAIAPGSTS